MITPDFSPHNPVESASVAEVLPRQESTRHLLELVTDELDINGTHAEEIGQLIGTIFPASQRCKLDLFAHVGGQVNPSRPNLLATIVRTDWSSSRFVGPHEVTSFDVLAIPDGLHMTKNLGITETDQAHLRSLESPRTLADDMETYLSVVNLIVRLELAIAQEQRARSIENSVGTNFVSDAEVQELIGLVEGPRVDVFGDSLK